eukprot:739889-Pyramimonas_sp.AAC.1
MVIRKPTSVLLLGPTIYRDYQYAPPRTHFEGNAGLCQLGTTLLMRQYMGHLSERPRSEPSGRGGHG